MSGSIAVTGAQGFVGGHLLARLGARAIALDADVTDADALAEAVAAASSGERHPPRCASSVAASWTDAGEPWRVNALGTVNLLDAVRSHAPGARVLVVSTGEVYGQRRRSPDAGGRPVRRRSRPTPRRRRPPSSPRASPRAPARRRRRPRLPARRPGRDERFAVGSWARPDRARRGSRAAGRCSSATSVRSATSPTCATSAAPTGCCSTRPSRPAPTTSRPGARSRCARCSSCSSRLARCPIEVEPDPARFRPSEVTVLCGDRVEAAGGDRLGADDPARADPRRRARRGARGRCGEDGERMSERRALITGSPARTAPTSPSCCSTRATRCSAWSAAPRPRTSSGSRT